MKQRQQRQQRRNKDQYPKNDSNVNEDLKFLVTSKNHAKKNLDQTIRSPNQYVSWYHYNTKNIDKYLTLCPHCKKPTQSAFNRSVIDSAINYLNGKRMFRQYSTDKGNALLPIIYLFVFGIVIYFLLNYI